MSLPPPKHSETPAGPSPDIQAQVAPAVTWSDPQREQAFDVWLSKLAGPQQLKPQTLRPASADASFRRYLRIGCAIDNGIDGHPRSRIIMDAPPDKENCEPFVKVAGLMALAGLNVPRILAWDAPQGFMLLDDLGHQTMMEVIQPDESQANHALYMQAVDALIAWQLASRPGVLPPYDEALLARELALFPDWYLAQHRGVMLQGQDRQTLDEAFAKIIARNLAQPCVYVHRDFMPRNLMIPGTGMNSAVGTNAVAGPQAALGVLDFQDAVYGPITYDIASLMRDAFLTWGEDFVLDITIRYWQKARKAGLPVGDDFGEFYRGVEWMGLQRHLKVAGIFARLTLRDGKPKYLADTPRFLHYIRSTADRYRELGPFLKVIDRIEGTEAVTGFAYGRM
jgi:aminoglycoside/choline kinase family phosphotransferase